MLFLALKYASIIAKYNPGLFETINNLTMLIS